MTIGKGSAPGKVILSGEHSVVYGYPAVVAAIGLRCEVIASENGTGLTINAQDLNRSVSYSTDEIKRLLNGKVIYPKIDNIAVAALEMGGSDLQATIEIRSDIPVGAGLGSSAAVSVATIGAVADLLDKQPKSEEISKMAFHAEKIAHGTPSGIDNTIATYGGALRFQDGNITRKPTKSNFPLIIVNTKVPRNTKELVTNVRELKDKHPNSINSVLNSMAKITDEFEKMFDEGALIRMGELFDVNQGLLDAIGVGHPKLSELIWQVRDLGALGAKLTGAGGGGCLIALTYNMEEAKKITQKLRANKLEVYHTEISSTGVIIGDST
jgi:mevalonate kinase